MEVEAENDRALLVLNEFQQWLKNRIDYHTKTESVWIAAKWMHDQLEMYRRLNDV